MKHILIDTHTTQLNSQFFSFSPLPFFPPRMDERAVEKKQKQKRQPKNKKKIALS